MVLWLLDSNSLPRPGWGGFGDLGVIGQQSLSQQLLAGAECLGPHGKDFGDEDASREGRGAEACSTGLRHLGHSCVPHSAELQAADRLSEEEAHDRVHR